MSRVYYKQPNQKTRPNLSCDLHKMGANIYSKFAVAPFSAKKYDGWMGGLVGGWMGGHQWKYFYKIS